MEIERKYLLKSVPENLEGFPSSLIEQAYLTTDPVIRVRKRIEVLTGADGEGSLSGAAGSAMGAAGAPSGKGKEEYYLTYKGKGMMAREEHELFLTPEAYAQLLAKAEGNVISKRRYLIPYGERTIELDVFDPPFAPLIMAEVEFPSIEEAENFIPPDWFGKEVTDDPEYHNSNMSKRKL